MKTSSFIATTHPVRGHRFRWGGGDTAASRATAFAQRTDRRPRIFLSVLILAIFPLFLLTTACKGQRLAPGDPAPSATESVAVPTPQRTPGGNATTPALTENDPEAETAAAPPLWGDFPHKRPVCVRGIHMTSWHTGSTRLRRNFERLFAETELNTAVITIKEIDGNVYIPGFDSGHGFSPYKPAMRDIADYLTFLKDRGVYTIARMVVFQDGTAIKHKPEWAIKSSSPLARAEELGYRADVWYDRRSVAWIDPYNKEAGDYLIRIAERAAQLGFQGIQFDYIRFPSDGQLSLAVYSQPHSRASREQAIADFLARARKRLKPHGVEISIDVFGLVGSYSDDMGIGQRLTAILPHVDVVSPMMYPSHYGRMEYGLQNPEAKPYAVVYRGVADTLRTMADSGVELRPFLQDFSLRLPYGPREVRAQIEAAADHGIHEWLLWNPSCRYTRDALKPFPEGSVLTRLEEGFVPASVDGTTETIAVDAPSPVLDAIAEPGATPATGATGSDPPTPPLTPSATIQRTP